MSNEENNVETPLFEIDAKDVMAVCGSVTNTKILVGWMSRLIDENVKMMTELVEGWEENRTVRTQHLASQMSAFVRIRNGALCALAKAERPATAETDEPKLAVGAHL